MAYVRVAIGERESAREKARSCGKEQDRDRQKQRNRQQGKKERHSSTFICTGHAQRFAGALVCVAKKEKRNGGGRHEVLTK